MLLVCMWVSVKRMMMINGEWTDQDFINGGRNIAWLWVRRRVKPTYDHETSITRRHPRI